MNDSQDRWITMNNIPQYESHCLQKQLLQQLNNRRELWGWFYLHNEHPEGTKDAFLLLLFDPKQRLQKINVC